MEKVLVTGGAGFIGSHVVEQLKASGYGVVVVDDLSTGKRINLSGDVKFYELDILDKKLNRVFENENINAVCHLAASTNVPKSIENPIKDAKTNILGMLNLLENCKEFGVKKFIFSSTGGALYGNTDILPTPEDHPTQPISPYGVDKLTGEKYLYYYNKVHNLPVVILRYSNVYGPKQERKGEGGVVAIFIKQLLAGKQPTINGKGEQTRDFVYVEDVARANLLALEESREKLYIYNISTGKDTSINSLYTVLAEKLGATTTPSYGPLIGGEVIRSCLDNEMALKELRWRPEYSLSDGLNKTIEYFNLQK